MFSSPVGKFQFVRLLFGISSVPEIFQKVMSHVLNGLPGVLCYLDDILVFASSQEEHDQRLRNVLVRLQDSGVKLNASKCNFSVEEIEFLGHVFDKYFHPTAFHLTRRSKKLLINFPTPTCARDL